MDAGEFFDRIEAHPELEGVGLEEGENPSAIIRHIPTGSKFKVEISAIGGQSWEALEKVLLGKRDIKVLSHMTRVVGYYSKVENWNRSKVGELDGRHKGNYAVRSTASGEGN